MTKSSKSDVGTEGFLFKRPDTIWAARSSGLIPTIDPFFMPMGDLTPSIITDLLLIIFS
jgi:hypothetical protein